eukprot:TRINITY_DN76893_c0_g1_i1.p1 TRINITY_DN76893_c0_g1~~TRINITY_DN76893_c0_g1_i1.p1  ORF type:complete len:347 (-),score=80.62 TRINITY_DN76893_c0_g1_i1:41-1039(-)
MAAGGGKDDDLGDVYELLEVSHEASEKEIQAAYRRGSLKCHPDRNPDDPEAAQKFDRFTRAKDLLLNPLKRAEIDRVRKAKQDLEKRFAQEDSKRRRLREDLEKREKAVAQRGESNVQSSTSSESAADIRKRLVQTDFAARIKAREADLAGRQADIATEVLRSRCEIEAARVRLSWREGAVVTAELISKELTAFGMKSLKMEENCSAAAQLGSREDALRAVLHFRERKYQVPFRVAMIKVTKPVVESEAVAPPRDRHGVDALHRGSKPAATEKERTTFAQASPAPPPAQKESTAGGAFASWEADMLSDLAVLAAAQRRGPQIAAPPKHVAAL